MKKYTISYLTDIDEKDITMWNLLWQKSPFGHYFNSYIWFLTCKEVFSEFFYEVVFIKEGERLVAVLPLVKKERLGLGYVTNPGEKYIDRSALLTDKADFGMINFLIKELSIKGSFILPEITEEFEKIFKKNKNVTVEKSGTNLRLPFGDNPIRFLDKKQRKKIEKILRIYGKDLRIEMKRGSISALKKAISIDMKSYREKKNIGTFRNEIDKKFFLTLVKLNRDAVGINILYFKKKPIAYEVGIRSKKIYSGLNKSFDNNYRHLIPGKVIAFLLFMRLYEEGIEEFDFCRGEDMLKKSFTREFRIQYNAYFIKNPLKKAVFTTLFKAKHALINNSKFYSTYRKLIYLKYI